MTTTIEQLVAEARELLNNATFADGQGIILTQDAEALEAALARYDAEKCRHVNLNLELDRAGGTFTCTDCGASEQRNG